MNEVRDTVRSFRETFEDEEDALTIPRVSGIMNVEGDEWFFGDDGLRVMAGRLLGQFQHRVAQYNYVSEREVLKRWANSYDTRLFIRRRIYETEPVVGVVEGFDLPLVQYLRVAAGGDTLVPNEPVAHALSRLWATKKPTTTTRCWPGPRAWRLHLDLPAPIVGEMLEEISREGLTDFPEPPAQEMPDEGGRRRRRLSNQRTVRRSPAAKTGRRAGLPGKTRRKARSPPGCRTRRRAKRPGVTGREPAPKRRLPRRPVATTRRELLPGELSRFKTGCLVYERLLTGTRQSDKYRLA